MQLKNVETNYVVQDHHQIKNTRAIVLDKLTVRELYLMLLLSSCNIPTSQKYCGKVFPNENFDWKKNYILTRVTTINNFQRNFQYKIIQSRSHWKCTAGLQKHKIFECLYAFLSCILCFHVCTNICFPLISNVHIVRTSKNGIPFQTFDKWHHVSYRYISYVKSETSDIWRTGV